MLSLILAALLAADATTKAPEPKLSDSDRIQLLNAQVAMLQKANAKAAAEKADAEEQQKFQMFLGSLYEKYKLAPTCQIMGNTQEIKCPAEGKK